MIVTLIEIVMMTVTLIVMMTVIVMMNLESAKVEEIEKWFEIVKTKIKDEEKTKVQEGVGEYPIPCSSPVRP